MSVMLIRRERLGEDEENGMLRLLDSQFEGVTLEGFREDLANKEWVLIFRSGNIGEITGFSTIAHYLSNFDGDPIQVVCSGDTVVSPETWRSGNLARHWWPAIRRIAADHPGLPLYWLLISSGYRTYRFMTSFAKVHYPSWRWRTPPRMQALMNGLATARFGKQFCPATGIVRLDRPMRLRAHLNGIPLGRMKDPDVGFFDQVNPMHDAGEELVCLALAEPSNLTPLGLRIAARAEPRCSRAETAP